MLLTCFHFFHDSRVIYSSSPRVSYDLKKYFQQKQFWRKYSYKLIESCNKMSINYVCKLIELMKQLRSPQQFIFFSFHFFIRSRLILFTTGCGCEELELAVSFAQSICIRLQFDDTLLRYFHSSLK